jgi:putative ABC transport system permease protein
MSSALLDLRYAVRMLAKNPSFTAVTVLTLALGIGANTAIFTIIHSVLLNPFPYPEQDRLVQIRQDRPQQNTRGAALHAGQEYLAFREASSFEHVAVVETVSRNISVGGEQPERHFGAKVSPNLFTMLGMPAAVGRALANDEQGRGARASVVLGHGVWQRRFGGDRSVIGKTIELDGEPYTVAGVMPERFGYAGTEFWFPFPFAMSDPPRTQRWYQVLARLKRGASLEQANSELAAIAGRIEQEFRSAHVEYRGWSVTAIPLTHAFLGNIRVALLVLSAAVGVVLLIACANVAGLLLARATARRQEVAVRAALGASRGRLIRQFLLESGMLAVVAGGLGLLFGAWGTEGLRALVPRGGILSGGNVPSEAVVGMSSAVLWFTAAVSLATVFLFGLWPALEASRILPGDVLREAGRGGTGSPLRQRARNALVVTEVALALVMLASAGLLVRTFVKLMRVEPGFNAENVVTMRFNLPPATYRTGEDKARFYEQLIALARAVPGVESAAVASHPVFGFTERWEVSREGEEGSGQRRSADSRTISAGYYAMMGIPLVRGREFTAQDRSGQPPVAVINETMARQFWPDVDPIGRRLNLYFGGRAFPSTVVGVVRDSLQIFLDQPVEPEVNLAMGQAAGLYRRMNLMVRTKVPPETLVDALRAQVWQIDKGLPVYGVATMRESIAASLAPRRLALWLLALFAGLAVLLAAAGLHAVISYTVAQRTREIGVRLALGAQRQDILRMVIRQGLTLAGIGVVIGLASAMGVTRVLAGLLYGVTPLDVWTFSGVALLLLVVAAAACYGPARRAMAMDPAGALRYE